MTRSIATVPEATTVDEWKDYFGNTVSMISILETHDRFSIEAVSRVRVEERPLTSPSNVAWEAARDQLAVHRSVDALEAFEFVFDSPFVAGSIELADYATPSFDPGRPLLAAAGELSHRIHAEFTYKPSSTNIETPLLEALRHKRGVCQDFSHVMIGALRSLGLAARYVSGYLRSGADYQGAEASHAWVSVFVPGIGWVDFDPTNDVMPGHGPRHAGVGTRLRRRGAHQGHRARRRGAGRRGRGARRADRHGHVAHTFFASRRCTSASESPTISTILRGDGGAGDHASQRRPRDRAPRR